MKRWVWNCILMLSVVLGLSGCSSESDEPCAAHDIFCSREAKAEVKLDGTAYVGTSFELDASESVYDKLRWYFNDLRIDNCDDKDTCTVTLQATGAYEFRVWTKVNSVIGLNRNPITRDEKTITVDVFEPGTSNSSSSSVCDAAVASTGGIYASHDDEKCLILEKTDRRACRAYGYSECVTGEQAQSICDGDWRLPSNNHWITLTTMILARTDAVDGDNLCVRESKECRSDNGRYPNRYVTTSTYSKNDGVGSFTGFDIFFPFTGISYQGHIRDSDPSHQYSVRCVQRIVY